jgi:hypothetical protein
MEPTAVALLNEISAAIARSGSGSRSETRPKEASGFVPLASPCRAIASTAEGASGGAMLAGPASSDDRGGGA